MKPLLFCFAPATPGQTLKGKESYQINPRVVMLAQASIHVDVEKWILAYARMTG